jgi:hypothetical protein
VQNRARANPHPAFRAQAGRARQRYFDEGEKTPEDEAYRLLRKLAMDRSMSMGTVAEQNVAYAKLLA